MRIAALFFGCLFLATGIVRPGDLTEASKIWDDLAATRNKLPSFHEEFKEVTTAESVNHKQSSERSLSLDGSQNMWREKSSSGSGAIVRIFDGENLFSFEDGDDEYVRDKQSSKKDSDPQPRPYSLGPLEWSKAVVSAHQPCGLSTINHECVIIDFEMKGWIRMGHADTRTSMTKGQGRIALDLQTGLIVSAHTVQIIQAPRVEYKQDTMFNLQKLGYGAPRDRALFQLPAGLTEVKELTKWNAPRIKKQLVGNPAPDLSAAGLDGQPISLASFKGKTVLLDFFTTWCGPCRADAPSLEKLYSKYGGKSLEIVGISVSEERATVEQYLHDHPHKYPTILTSENDMPRPFQIGVFPTYVVIAPDGTVAGATESTQGFAELQHMLKKAGMDTADIN